MRNEVIGAPVPTHQLSVVDLFYERAWVSYGSLVPLSALSRPLGTSSPHCAFPSRKRRPIMALETILVWLLIGAIAGWLAGVVVKGYGFGLVGNIVVGILGAVIGGWLFGAMGIAATGILGAIAGATFGAIFLLFVIRMVKRSGVSAEKN
jgi:uncharacterized membrane protein YeaQ/YmgE (transglycosylase-associated protein family)